MSMAFDDFVKGLVLVSDFSQDRAGDSSVSFEDLVKEDGFTMEEIRELAEHVEFE